MAKVGKEVIPLCLEVIKVIEGYKITLDISKRGLV